MTDTQEIPLGTPVKYWPGARSENYKPKRGTIISIVVMFGNTPCQRIRKDSGGTDFIALTHLEAAND